MTETRIEHDRALQRGMIAQLSDHTELSRQFGDNHSFKNGYRIHFFVPRIQSMGTDG